MARSAARLKMGYYPLPESEGGKLRLLLSFTGPASVVDPCVGQGTALNLLTQAADVRRYGVELDAERALAASATGIETIQGNAFDAVAKPESFSLLYLNPPYDSEIGSVGNNRMERLFLEHTFRWLVMEGVLVLVIPFERLHECAGILASHFARLNIFRMNIVPKKLKDGDNDALTTPLSVTGTAEELDAELSSTIVGFVGSHLQMRNTLEKAKAEMDAASKAAQAEARAKSQTATKLVPPKTEATQLAATGKPAEPAKPAQLQTANLFDVAAPAATPIVVPTESEEDSEPFVEIDDDEPAEEAEELDDAA